MLAKIPPGSGSGSDLAQVFPLVLLPAPTAPTGTNGPRQSPPPLPPAVDLGTLSKTLDGARAEGFAVSAFRAKRAAAADATARDLVKLIKVNTP